MDNKFETLSVIRDEILTDPNVNSRLIWDAAKIAEEDKYLYDLLVDWAKSIDDLEKSLFLNDILNYAEEKLRVLNIASN